MALSNGPNLGLLVNAAQGEAHFAEQQRLLRGLDALVQPSVKDKDLATPPGVPADGDRYIVAPAPTGAWVGHVAEIARWSSLATAWEFYVPKVGWRMYVEDEATPYTYIGTVWIPLLLAATVDTAGKGYVIVPYATPSNNQPFVVMVTAIDQTRAVQFVLPFRKVVRNIVTEVTTAGGAGKKYGAGIYDEDRVLLFKTAALDANVVALNETPITPVTLEPGVYFWAWTSDSTGTAAKGLDIGPTSFLKVGAAKRIGFGNNSSAGVLPATLGIISNNSFWVVAGMLTP